MRSRLFLGALAIGLFAAGCHENERTKTAADVGEGESGGGGETQERGGSGNQPPGNPPPEVVRPGAPMVTFPGFEVLADGRSVVSVDTTGPTTVSEQKAEGRVIYKLSGVSVPYKVNKLPLVTTNFPTQVSRVEVEGVDGGGANLIIELREPANGTVETSKIEGGTRVSVTFPRSEKFGAQAGPGGGGGATGATWEESEGGEHRSHKRAGTTDIETAERENEKSNEKEKDKGKKHTKRADRQPIPYVARHLTLPYLTLAPNAGVSLFGGGSGDPNVWVTGGVRFGIIDQIEIEATDLSLRLSPDRAEAFPSLGATFAFLEKDFEIGGRIRYFLPLDSSGLVGYSQAPLQPPPTPGLELALPMIVHLGKYAKIDTGVNVTINLYHPAGSGLVERLPVPLVEEPGIPVKVIFQPDPAFWIGAHTGYELQDFSAPGETSFIPLGAEAGITAYDTKRPTADLGVRFDSPHLFAPGASSKVQGDVYSFAAWLRWYYYL